jgi:hypothetical protein
LLCNGKCATKYFAFVGTLNTFVGDIVVLEVGMCMFMNKTFENGWDLNFTSWGQLGQHVCKMWEHGACLEIVQQDANVSKCGDLNQMAF